MGRARKILFPGPVYCYGTDMTKHRLLLIDANSLIHRAFHALPPLTTPKGEMVNAVYGFLLILFKAIKEFQPDSIAAAFDVAAPTFRHERFKEYKAKRIKAPNELYSQIPLVKEALSAFSIPVYEKEGFEADDILGTLAKKIEEQQLSPSIEIIIVSGDLDMLQAVTRHTKVYTMRKGIQDSVLYDQEMVKGRFGGLEPSQLKDYKGLCGDASDNIPGVRGIGEKTAIALLQEFGSLEHLYEQLGKEGIKPKLRETLLKQKEQAFLSKELATIREDVPLEVRLQDVRWERYDRNAVRALLERFDFRSLINRMSEIEEKRGEERAEKKQQGRMFAEKHKEEREKKEDILARIERLYQEEVFSKEVYEIEKELVPIITRMEELGIKIDKPYFKKLAQDMEKELSELSAKIYQAAGKKFNINSTQQLSQVLFEDFQLSPKGLRKTPKGVISTASEELEKLRELHRAIPDILRYRELQKLYSTYILPLPEMTDGNSRIHTHFDQLGAATGRISSSLPNLQNIPILGPWGKAIRRGFIAEQGFSLLSFDYSQMELRIAAYLAKEEKMRAFFQKGADIHRMTAAEVFGVAVQQVTDEMRYRAKALNFGVLYGMGATGFARSAGISFEEAQNFIENYFARFPRIQEYMEQTKEFAKTNGYVQTVLGRKRYLPEISSASPRLRAAAERMAVNHPIQGSLADIMKMAMIRVSQITGQAEGDCRMLLQIHDELLFEVAGDKIDTIAPQIRSCMENVYDLQIPVVVQAKAGKSWGDEESVLLKSS